MNVASRFTVWSTKDSFGKRRFVAFHNWHIFSFQIYLALATWCLEICCVYSTCHSNTGCQCRNLNQSIVLASYLDLCIAKFSPKLSRLDFQVSPKVLRCTYGEINSCLVYESISFPWRERPWELVNCYMQIFDHTPPLPK